MDHATMKTHLQRRLQDTAAVQFSSGTVDELLAIGISKLQAFIHDINPAALVSTNTFNTVAGTDLYAKQVSSMRVIRIEMAKAAGGYEKLPMRNFLELIEDESTAFEEGTVAVADLGNQWFMHPTPDEVKTVRVWYVPIITTSAGWDAVATQIPPVLHTLVIDFALLEGLAETAEATNEIRSRINETLALIPSLYGRTNEQVMSMSLSPFSSVGA